ncbi:peptide-methionine (S)-S-oxide reductase MsrA [Paenibacillus sp. LHD-117]|uniref:peptide-methionine (S)-S-oxide reductase MsrA n=1 Tax=Paenibacillus sp. LHD-117 TaxID=3071412 RepID=UPI0035A8FF0C
MPFQSDSQFCSATFGMGCFWGPEARFGALPGVVRTRVGYAGGSSLNPTYRELGNHTETLQVEFDETILTYEHILRTFWDNHNPYNTNGYKGRQYQSLLFYHDDSQKVAIDAELRRRSDMGLGRPDTEIIPYAGFYSAEERHQKYYVKRYPNAVATLESLFPSRPEGWADTTIAARLNGLAKGYTNLERLKTEIASWPLPEADRDDLLASISGIRW